MASFVDCWNLLSKNKERGGEPVLGDADRTFIEDRIRQEVRAGIEPVEAAKIAVGKHLEHTNQQLGSIYEQAGVRSPSAETPPPQGLLPEQTGNAPSGISNERLKAIYGEDALIPGQGRGPREFRQIGEADTRDPYAVLSAAKQHGIVPPDDVPVLRKEHQRLLNQARAAYGTPEYGQLAQNAADMANAIKGVAHGPASDVMRSLQEVDIPRYDSPADFDNIVRERMKRETTPVEQQTFSKVANELKNGDREVAKSAADAQTRLRKYRPKEQISFDEAVDRVRNQIKDLTKDCI